MTGTMADTANRSPDAGRCGPLDVADQAGYISTAAVPDNEVDLARAIATRSPHYDGLAVAPGSVPTAAVAVGHETLAKVQHREHERLASSLWFDQLRTELGLPAPELLDSGEVDTPSGPRWWVVMRRVHGEEAGEPRPSRMRALGRALRTWHDQADHHGLRLDDPGGLGVLLGSFRKQHPDTYPEAAARLADICTGQPMTAIHGDVAVGHNALFDGDKLAAFIDPGAVHIAPPMLDLAWCLAVDLPRGADTEPLLDGYGHDGIDHDAMDALLPHLCLRRLVDTHIIKRRAEAEWLTAMLDRTAPDLLRLAEPGQPR